MCFLFLMTAGVCVLRVRQGSIIRWRSDGVRWGRSGDRQRNESRSLPYLSGKAAGRIRFCRRKTSLRSAFFRRNIGRILESWDQNRGMMCRIRSVWPVWHRRCWEMRLDLKRQSWPLSAKKSMRSEWRKKICRNLRAILYIKMAISIICIWARLKMSLAWLRNETGKLAWCISISYPNLVYTAPGRKASDCVKCGKCEKVCLQHLQIRNLLEDVVKEFEAERAWKNFRNLQKVHLIRLLPDKMYFLYAVYQSLIQGDHSAAE